MDPRNPCYLAVSGSDEYVRLYDCRKSYVNGDSPFGCPVDYFCPPHLIGQNKDGITGLAFSQAGEMLASYSYDNIYLFERDHGLHFNNFKVGETLMINEDGTFPPSFEKLLVPRTFKGHQNMQTVKEIATAIVIREGGYVNDPDDPGGATNFGVTIHTMRRLHLDLTGDGTVDVEDVRRLTQAQAIDIFIKHYFEAPLISELPRELQPTVFDMYVNAGGNAVKILQNLLRDMGYELAVDGALGPKSLAAVRAAMKSAPDHLVDAYGIARRNYYFRIADKRPASRKYARTRAGGKGGWIVRAEEFISPRYHMSQAAFQQRVASWG